MGIRLAQASIDNELAARLEQVYAGFERRQARAFEACDRAILDVAGEGVRRELERAVQELDVLCAEVASAVRDICTYDLFDPLRVLAPTCAKSSSCRRRSSGHKIVGMDEAMVQRRLRKAGVGEFITPNRLRTLSHLSTQVYGKQKLLSVRAAPALTTRVRMRTIAGAAWQLTAGPTRVTGHTDSPAISPDRSSGRGSESSTSLAQLRRLCSSR